MTTQQPTPGWVCPLCNAVYAPFILYCPDCKDEALAKAHNRRQWEKLALVKAMMEVVDIGRQQSMIAPFRKP